MSSTFDSIFYIDTLEFTVYTHYKHHIKSTSAFKPMRFSIKEIQKYSSEIFIGQ